MKVRGRSSRKGGDNGSQSDFVKPSSVQRVFYHYYRRVTGLLTGGGTGPSVPATVDQVDLEGRG